MEDVHEIVSERKLKKLMFFERQEKIDFWSVALLIMLVVIFILAVLDLAG